MQLNNKPISCIKARYCFPPIQAEIASYQNDVSSRYFGRCLPPRWVFLSAAAVSTNALAPLQMLRASPCARRLRASQSWVFGPAACPVAQTPIPPDRLIIDKRKTLPRELVSNRAAPAAPRRAKEAAPLPSPFALGSQLPTGCALSAGRPGWSREGCTS